MILYNRDSGLGKSYTSFVVHDVQRTISTQGQLYAFVANKMNNVSDEDNIAISFKFKEFRLWLNEGVSTKVVRIILSYVGAVNKMVWRKEI